MSRSALHTALEIIELSQLPTLAGWTRKVAELEQHKANMGKINDAGVFFVQAARKPDHRLDWATQVIRCLFWTPEDGDLKKVVNAAHLVLAYHCAPRMLEPWPDLFNWLSKINIRRDGDDGWKIPRVFEKPSEVYSYHFSRRIYNYGLDKI